MLQLSLLEFISRVSLYQMQIFPRISSFLSYNSKSSRLFFSFNQIFCIYFLFCSVSVCLDIVPLSRSFSLFLSLSLCVYNSSNNFQNQFIYCLLIQKDHNPFEIFIASKKNESFFNSRFQTIQIRFLPQVSLTLLFIIMRKIQKKEKTHEILECNLYKKKPKKKFEHTNPLPIDNGGTKRARNNHMYVNVEIEKKKNSLFSYAKYKMI